MFRQTAFWVEDFYRLYSFRGDIFIVLIILIVIIVLIVIFVRDDLLTHRGERGAFGLDEPFRGFR